MVIGARHHDLSGLQWLAQGIEDRFCEFREFIKKQNPAMGQRNFAGPCPRTAADKRRHRGGMVRIAERTALHQPAGGQLAGDGMQHCHIQRLAW